MAEIKQKKERIQSIDALRGLCVVLMVGHHFLFDLVEFLGAPPELFMNPLFMVLQPLFAGCFILLAGVSSRFSRSNTKRGFKVLAAAAVISAVTYFMRMPVWFGILHFLGVAMVFYGLTGRFWESLPQKPLPWLFAALIPLSMWLRASVNVQSPYLWVFGFAYDGFFSSDYFPLLPWIFVFLFGAWLGKPLREGRLPGWVYSMRPPRFFCLVGRQAFIVYLLHQPVLYALTMLIAYLR